MKLSTAYSSLILAVLAFGCRVHGSQRCDDFVLSDDTVWRDPTNGVVFVYYDMDNYCRLESLPYFLIKWFNSSAENTINVYMYVYTVYPNFLVCSGWTCSMYRSSHCVNPNATLNQNDSPISSPAPLTTSFREACCGVFICPYSTPRDI